ncbi:Ion transport protein-domain-containing protein [Blastocladiella britannica]|nr:Ion transport protein-domain-containing protein [Blastocladiella britannica]
MPAAMRAAKSTSLSWTSSSQQHSAAVSSSESVSITSSRRRSLASVSSHATSLAVSQQDRLSIAPSSFTTGSTSTSGTTGMFIHARLVDAHWSRRELFDIVTSNTFGNLIMFIIMINTATLAVQTTASIQQNYGWYLAMADQVFLGIYLMETFLKLVVFHTTYFKAGWNIFDFIIVITSILSFALDSVSTTAFQGFNPKVMRIFRVLKAFRAIRSLRALRAISVLKSLQVIVEALLASIPALSSIIALFALNLYIFAVVARSVYGSYDKWRFGSMGSAVFRIFATVTLDDWSTIYRDNPDAPGLSAFLMLFVILENFVLLNLLVAVIVSNLATAQARMDKLRRKDKRQEARELRDAEQEQQDGGSQGDLSSTQQDANDDASTRRCVPQDRSADPMFPNHANPHAFREAMIDQVLGGDPIDMFYPVHAARKTKMLASTFCSSISRLESGVAGYREGTCMVMEMLEAASSHGMCPSSTSTAAAPESSMVSGTRPVRFQDG